MKSHNNDTLIRVFINLGTQIYKSYKRVHDSCTQLRGIKSSRPLVLVILVLEDSTDHDPKSQK